MMSDVAKFYMIGTEEFEDDAIRPINSEAPDFVMLRMQLLSMERRVKRVSSKEIGLADGLPLNWFGEFLEQSIECGSRREFEHDRLSDQLS
jgi:hypothetical protein